MDRLTIMIADDHPLFRVGLKYALEAQGFAVAAEAGNGLEAVAHCRAIRPQVALLDIKMPMLDGIEACRLIRAELPEVIVVMLTTFEEPAIIAAARQAGAISFLSKETEPSALARIIRHIVAAPSRHWLPEVAIPQLTAREQQVLALLAQGLANKAIARQLDLSTETVKDYLNGIYRKLEVGDRLQALNRARELGLV